MSERRRRRLLDWAGRGRGAGAGRGCPAAAAPSRLSFRGARGRARGGAGLARGCGGRVDQRPGRQSGGGGGLPERSPAGRAEALGRRGRVVGSGQGRRPGQRLPERRRCRGAGAGRRGGGLGAAGTWRCSCPSAGEERGGAQGCGRPGGGGGAGARRKLRGRSGGAGPGEGCGGAWALGGPGGARAARALRKGAGGGRSGGRGAKSILRGEGRRASLGHRLPGARRGLWGHPGGQGPGDDGGVGRGSPGAQRECGETGGEGLTRGRGCRAVLQPRGSVWNAELSPQARSSARVAWRRHLRQARLEAAPAPRRTWPPSAHGALGLRPCRVSREDPSCSAPLLSWRGSDWPALGARKVVPNPLAPTVRLPSVPRGWRAWCPWGRWRWGSQQLGGGRGLVWSGGAEVW